MAFLFHIYGMWFICLDIEQAEGVFAVKKPSAAAVARGLTSILALPAEITLNQPLLTMIGGGELSVENHKGIIEYTTEIMRINTAAGVITVEGQRLVVKQLTAERILVRGVIQRVAFTR